MFVFEKLGQIGKTFLEKIEGSWEIVKLNSLVSAQNAIISEQKARLGDYYWEKIKNGADYEPEVSEIVEGIRGGYDEIETVQAEIRDLKGAIKRPKKCAECGSRNPFGMKFCQNCGEELKRPEAEREEVAELIVCRACGAACAVDANYCGMCGVELDEDEDDNEDVEAKEFDEHGEVGKCGEADECTEADECGGEKIGVISADTTEAVRLVSHGHGA